MGVDLVAGALGNLAPKLLHDEYKLPKGVTAQVESLSRELGAMHLALCKVAQVPYDRLDPQVKLWASEVREASYDMEDILDTFLVRVDGGSQRPDEGRVERLMDKMGKLFSLSKLMARRDIAGAIEDIKMQVDGMAKRRERYRVDDHVASSATTTSIDPRVLTLHTQVSELVGIEGTRADELIKMLTVGDDDDPSCDKMKIVSIIGTEGLGKTTLAKVVYENLTRDLNIQCKAFVRVGQKPDLKKVLRDILLGLDKDYYLNKTNFMILDEGQLIEEIQNFLKEKRFFIVIDDVWEVSSWNLIRTALDDNNLGSKIIITTRSSDVAETVRHSYKLKPLPLESSKILIHGRIFGSANKCPDSISELSDKILNKCGGVPLAIITIASLLANKSDDITEWQEVCNSIGSGLISSSNDMYKDMRKILSLSYYDLPPHMKTFLLYLSIYPEDYTINNEQLIWKWIAEGFIQPKEKCDDLFELGKSYLNDLINRSLVQSVRSIDSVEEIYECRVHDMIHHLICFLSREQNFVTTSDDISGSKKARRLCLKDTTWPKTGVSQVRSTSSFLSLMDSMPSFSSFDLLHVLDLEGCSLNNDSGGSKLCVENLIHLRYLGLHCTLLKEVPRGLENLQFLQVLKMDYLSGSLMVSIFGLRRLMCLEGVSCNPKPGNLLRNLTSLQVLDQLIVDKDSAGAVEELGHLTKLRKLNISMELQMDQSISDSLINSLSNLPRLQKLLIIHDLSLGNNHLIKWECWSPPPHLRELCIMEDYSFRTMPKWISPASLPHLTCLTLSVVHTVRPEDIQVLGMLPKIWWLDLVADRGNLLERPWQTFVVSADAFPRVKRCMFENFVNVPSMFARGAMPRADTMNFCLRARDFFSNTNGGLNFDDLAMEHLPSLENVYFKVHGKSEISKEEEAKLIEALRHAANVHPKHPIVDIRDENGQSLD